MPTETIATAAPSSAENNNAPAPTPAPASATPAAPPSAATSAFGAALEKAANDAANPPSPTPTPKPADTKPADTKPAGETPKPKDDSSVTPPSKKDGASDDLPKLGSKDLLKKDEKPKTGTEDEPLSEDDLKEELNNPHKKEKSTRRYRQLWDNWKREEARVVSTQKELDEKNARLNDLEAKIKIVGDKAGVAPEVQKDLEELAMFRRERMLEGDPQVKVLFDDRVDAAEGAIMDILIRNGLPVDYKEQIKTAGGFVSFCTKTELGQELAKALDKIPFADRNAITAATAEQDILKRQKGIYFNTEKSKAKEFFEAKAKAEQEAIANRPDPRKEAEVMQQRFTTWKEGVKKEAKDVFGEQEIPADASEAVRKDLTEKNKFARQLSAALDQRVAAKTPEEWQDILLEAVLAHKFSADNKVLRAENEALKAELEKVRGAGRTVTRNGAPPPSTNPAPAKDEKPKSFGEALTANLEKTTV